MSLGLRLISQPSGSSIQPFGHNRYGPEIGESTKQRVRAYCSKIDSSNCKDDIYHTYSTAKAAKIRR